MENEWGLPEAPDPLKPPFPYTCGAQLTIRRHTPPPPFGGYGYKRPHRRRGINTRSYPHSSSLILAFPQPSTPPHPDQSSHRVTIVDGIASYDGRGAQLVTCYLDKEEHQIRVAKIYDPLYYEEGHDVSYLADAHYSCETAAYNKLCEMNVDGVHTPHYYGSWTFQIPLLNGHMRDVRMILVEHIPHPSMQSLIDAGRAANIAPHRRMQALAKAVEAYHWLEFWGVRQCDFVPRNVMVSETHDPVQQVRILDFSHARVRDLPNSTWVQGDPATAAKRPASPLIAFREDWGMFEDWVPSEMHSREARLAWRQRQWGDATKFEPLPTPQLNVLEAEVRSSS